MWMFQPRTDQMNGKVAGWSMRLTDAGQFATAPSVCIDALGAILPAATSAS